MPFAASMYAVGPLVAFAVIAALTAILKWTFKSDSSGLERDLFVDPPADYGLLSVLSVVPDAVEALELQRILAEAGIRSTTATVPRGRIRILVFTSDLDNARRVVGGSTI